MILLVQDSNPSSNKPTEIITEPQEEQNLSYYFTIQAYLQKCANSHTLLHRQSLDLSFLNRSERAPWQKATSWRTRQRNLKHTGKTWDLRSKFRTSCLNKRSMKIVISS